MTHKAHRILLAVAVTVLIALCVSAGLTYWLTGPALQCDQPSTGPAAPGWSARSVLSGNRERCYFLYAPPQYDPTQETPVVFSFHGFLSNPNSHSLITGWHELADEEGFLVIYPQGAGFPQRWNAGQSWGAPDVDDVQFFADMLDDLSARAAVDLTRVYVNGFSNGGGMTVRIGCKAAGQVAAIGSVAGAVVSMGDCAPSRPVPAIAFHGTSDPLVNYAGGYMGEQIPQSVAELADAPTYFLGAEEWTAAWAKHNGCNPTPETIPIRGDVRGLRYTGCLQGASVVLYTIEDGGHTWPGGTPIPFMGKTSRQLDATKEMWRFFRAHSLDD
jgi:polyhydroxybutyrate depolymerase